MLTVLLTLNATSGVIALQGDAGLPAAKSTTFSEFDAREFPGLREALTAIGEQKAALVISRSESIPAHVTVPANVSLKFIKEGSLAIAAQATVVIKGKIEAGPGQIFTGSGAVLFDNNSLREVCPQWWGARGDGTGDDTVAIRNAIASLAVNGGKVFIPAGTYLLGTIMPGNYYLESNLIALKSGVSISGAGSATILKLRDHFLDRPDDATANAHIFGGDNIANVTISDIKFDMNGRNNLTPSGKVRNAMAIRIAGTGGANIRIENCEFIDCAGHNVIGLWSPHGTDAFIINNRLKNGGHYVGSPVENIHNSDFSFIVSKWNNSRITGNIIEQENSEIALRSWSGGIELGGSNSLAQANTITGCDPAMYIPATTDPLENLQVRNNIMRDCLRGIAFWNALPIKNVMISENIISLNSSPQRKGRPCIGIEQPNGSAAEFTQANANAFPVENLTIRNNIITCNLPRQSSHPAQGIVLHSVVNGVVKGNIIDGLTSMGILINGSPWGTKNLTIRDNKVTNCGRGETVTGNRTGIYLLLSGTARVPARRFITQDLLIENNEFGNASSEIADATGNIVGTVCSGFQQAGISADLAAPGAGIENLIIRENSYRNLLHNIYTGSGEQILEKLHPEAHFIPEMIYSQVKPLRNRQLFGSEIIHYTLDGSVEKVAGFGYFTDKKGTVSGATGETVLKCDNSRGLRVGMFITISGAGKSGEALSGYITSLDRDTVTLDRKLLSPVNRAPYVVRQPTFVRQR